MKKPLIIFLGLIAVLVLCLIALSQREKSDSSDHAPADTLTLYCAAGLRNPVSDIIDQYTSETGRKVTVIYNGSGALLSQIQLGKGDLYLPANIFYIREAQKLGLAADETIPVSYLTAKIIVRKNNTSIQSLDDLAKPGVRISFANKSAAIGKFTRRILTENRLLKKIEANIIVTKPTVNSIIQDVDGITWFFGTPGVPAILQRWDTGLDNPSITFQSPPVSYCTAGVSAAGCTATLSATGTASATAASGFSLNAGGASYAIYLSHTIFLVATAKLGLNAALTGISDFSVQLIYGLYCILIVAVSVAYYYFLERSLHRWFKRGLRIKRPT